MTSVPAPASSGQSLGRGTDARAVRFGPGARPHFISLATQTGWCAADRRAAWISTADGRLLRIDPHSNAVATVARVVGAQLAVDGGNVWVAARDGVARVEKRSGRVQTFTTGGTVDALAIGAGRVWVVILDRRERSWLLRLDPRSGRVRARRRLPGSPSAVPREPWSYLAWRAQRPTDADSVERRARHARRATRGSAWLAAPAKGWAPTRSGLITPLAT